MLGHFPTGVTVVTGASDAGPVGLAIGSFTSVSLDPPLVGFLPGKTSGSWPLIEATGSFCVNVLSDQQQDTCAVFASKSDDKFADVEWEAAGTGSPKISGSLAWIDCDIHQVVEAGDHWFVMGLVRDLWHAPEGDPLIFFKGAYAGIDIFD